MDNFQDEKELERLRKECAFLQQINDDRSEFVSIAAHQLKTPITYIRWIVKSLIDSEVNCLSDEQRKRMLIADSSLERIFQISEDLLAVDRLEHAPLTLSVEAGGVEQALEEVIGEVEELSAQKRQTITRKFASPAHTVSFNRQKLKDAVSNLVTNAVRYTPVGGQITVKTSYLPDALQISIIDSGVGISKQDVPNLFQKYNYKERADDSRDKCVGLGLYIVKKIAEAHAGSISYQPNEPAGSVFVITLPVHK